jgi:acyl-CoA thioester hydrolase
MMLEIELPVKIRFSDTDAMGVVWHGNYLRFFEDAREAFGATYGLAYLDIYNNGYFTPIVKSSIEHKAPIYYGEEPVIKARYVFSAAAKLVFEYTIINPKNQQVIATGLTVQVFLRASDRVLELSKPEFFLAWENKFNDK